MEVLIHAELWTESDLEIPTVSLGHPSCCQAPGAWPSHYALCVITPSSVRHFSSDSTQGPVQIINSQPLPTKQRWGIHLHHMQGELCKLLVQFDLHLDGPFWCTVYVFSMIPVGCSANGLSTLLYCSHAIKDTVAPVSKTISIFFPFTTGITEICEYISFQDKECRFKSLSMSGLIPSHYLYTY